MKFICIDCRLAIDGDRKICHNCRTIMCLKCYEDRKHKYTSVGSTAYCVTCLLKMSKCTRCKKYFNGNIDFNGSVNICGPCYIT